MSATVVVNGTTTHAVLWFPEHDGGAAHHPGDSTCNFDSGNCAWDERTHATVSGNAPIDSAWLVTTGGTFLTYYVSVSQPGASDATCIINESIGEPVSCDPGKGNVTVTLAPQ
jgi:hypothetical protein